MLDLTEEEPWKDLKVLHNELASYREDLPAKARLVIVNKADLFWVARRDQGGQEQVGEDKTSGGRDMGGSTGDRREGIGGGPMRIVTVSAKKKQGTQMLAKTLVELLRLNGRVRRRLQVKRRAVSYRASIRAKQQSQARRWGHGRQRRNKSNDLR